MLLFVLIIVLSFSIIIYLWNIKTSYSYFKNRLIPTPSFDFFFGHYKTLWSTPSISRQFEKWTNQYGPIYGLYEGTRPVYVVSDVDFLQQVFVTQFSNFHSRRLPFITRLSNGNHVHIFGADGNRWRRQRHVINPTFTNNKLKLMLPLINDSIQIFMNKIQKQQENQFNIYTFYKQMTLDIICRCAFGIDTDVQNNENNPFLLKTTKFFEDNHEKLFIVKLSYLMPWLIPLLTQIVRLQMIIFMTLRSIIPRFINNSEELPGFWIINQIKNVINQRITQTKPKNRTDLLDLMLDAASSDQIKDNNTDQNFVSKYLHYDEVSSNVFLFMIAGHDTISTTLAYSTYILATKPDIQIKLRSEIDQMTNNQEELNYDSINNNDYLDFFIKEILRMFPIAIQAISRECNQDTTVCDYTICKGDVIQPDVYSLHYDPKLWGPEDPQLFLPERHSVRRHPMSFMAFGQGPRNCLGIRFALMEIKLCLVHLIKQYFILPSEKTEKEFHIRETLVIVPNAIYIKLQER